MKEQQRTFDPQKVKWVDLGLPSGRLWASENADGYYNYNDAVETFGEYLPKGVAFAELIEECTVEWDSNEKGLNVIGPNGNTIFLPAVGYIYPAVSKPEGIGRYGCYWSRMPYVNSKTFAPASQNHARCLYFDSGLIHPLNYDLRAYGFGVRPSRELN